MKTWRERLAPATVATWDRLVAVARSAVASEGLPEGLGLAETVATVAAVAEAKGILRRQPNRG